METLREIKNSVANPEAREDIQQLNLRLHNLKWSGDEIKRKQEEIVLSLEKLARDTNISIKFYIIKNIFFYLLRLQKYEFVWYQARIW